MKKKILIILFTALALATAGYFVLNSTDSDVSFRTETIAPGEIVKQVRATGTINPLQTVRVGSQVSGTISRLFADFNSVVKQGQIIAVIDSTFLNASVKEAEANLERVKAQLNEAERAYKRSKDLFEKNLVSQAELDVAQTTYETSVAQIKQADAALERARVNLRYAVIRSPIDGVVISRDVDVGQTVAASLQAPQLFAIANDLKRMQVEASVDEADIGQVQEGQSVTFTVDSYPDEEFEGTVTQVRLAPVAVQNVVTYTVIIEVPNPNQKLRPGMTATVSVLIAKRENVLRLPAIALRYQPSQDILEKVSSDQGNDTSAGAQGEVRRNRQRSDSARGGDWRGGRERRMGAPRPDGGGSNGTMSVDMEKGSFAKVWVLQDDGRLLQVPVRTGLSDQRYVEIIGGRLKEGDKVVLGVNMDTGSSARPGQTNPFAPQMQGPRRNP